MNFAYVALETSGKKRTGVIEAANRDIAVEQLSQEGRYVVEIHESKEKAASDSAFGQKKASRSDLALFTRRLADLSAAGLPLDRVLQVISEQSESPAIAKVCGEALREVRGGRAISDSLAMHPRMFPDVFTQTLRAGEMSGQFPQVAERLAEMQEKDVARRSQVTSAMVYPAILACTALLVVIFLLTFVVPRLSGVFKNLGNELPLSTKILMGTTGFVNGYGIQIIIVLGLAIFFTIRYVRTDQGAYVRDKFLMNLPIAGALVRKAVVSRYARVLGTLVFGGVPILDALKLAGLAAGNKVFLRSSQQVREEVQEGRQIAVAMKDAGAFPPVLINMVAVGEETGNLPMMLNRVSESLDFEVDNGMRRLTSFIEPIIVLAMGAIVGFVVLSVLLPIYQAQDIVK